MNLFGQGRRLGRADGRAAQIDRATIVQNAIGASYFYKQIGELSLFKIISNFKLKSVLALDRLP